MTGLYLLEMSDSSKKNQKTREEVLKIRNDNIEKKAKLLPPKYQLGYKKAMLLQYEAIDRNSKNMQKDYLDHTFNMIIFAINSQHDGKISHTVEQRNADDYFLSQVEKDHEYKRFHLIIEQERYKIRYKRGSNSISDRDISKQRMAYMELRSLVDLKDLFKIYYY